MAPSDANGPTGTPPRDGADPLSYRTRGGILVERRSEPVAGGAEIEALIEALEPQRGVLLSSSYDYPGRYTRWDIGFGNPPLELAARERSFTVRALNARGRVLLPAIEQALRATEAVATLDRDGEGRLLTGSVRRPERRFAEEERSRQPSVFSVLRALVDLFGSPEDPHLGLYGAFGYDLAFQFEPVRPRLERPSEQRDLVLYLPDELLVVDHQREQAQRLRYEFVVGDRGTAGIAREGPVVAFQAARGVDRTGDHSPGQYAAMVVEAKKSFQRGDLFEVVPGQTFFEPCPAGPGEIFRRLRRANPAPYGFLMNLGEDEWLVGASPEMYVRVEGSRVETCPISGTIARGRDAVEDAEQIRELLSSRKDESELTMCTDVDRNDKSRICVPGSVRVIGRRQIELYSRLIHTVDHVEGTLRDGFDALDAFLTHAWAVTVTGAPKLWAMQWIEDREQSPRAWYGGAVGKIGFDGNLNTGLTLRTIRIKDGVAAVRAGATLLWDSDPEAEEHETRVKAAALLDAIRGATPPDRSRAHLVDVSRAGAGRRVLLVDHEDSFVHTLANYIRQTGAEVVTLRSGFPEDELDRLAPDLVVLSPGPGTPSDFDVSGTIAKALSRHLPIFGVCLGLQGIVEHFGGTLGVLDTPMHGKPSAIHVKGGRIFEGLPPSFRAGRYHSLFARPERLPACLRTTAETEDGVIMAVEHVDLPLAAVQFHPESILTLDDDVGLRLLANALRHLGTTSAKRSA